MTYSATTLMIFSLSKYLITGTDPALSVYYTVINAIMNIISNFIFAKAFLCRQ
jgi:hypothetical protein